MMGTGGYPLSFNFERTLAQVMQAMFSIPGFNEGPEYLVGARLISLPWNPAWILASMLAIAVTLSIFWGMRCALIKPGKRISLPLLFFSIRWPILLVAIALLLLIPPISTIRVEQRWLFAPFILMLLVSTWAVGQPQSKARIAILTLIVTVSVSSILLDSAIVKHFDQLFFVSSGRFADMVKRDIADKYPGDSSDIELWASEDQCQWSLLRGRFFRIYGGQARKVRCVSANDYSVRSKFGLGTHIFAEVSAGHLADITNEWQARMEAHGGRVSFDFISAFPNGHINNSAKVDTPTGKGVLLFSWPSAFGVENTMTVLSGFSYRFDDVLVERGSRVRFGLSMIYPTSEPVRCVVYVVEQGTSKLEVLFSREVKPPGTGEKLSFSPVTLPLAAYSGERISLIFAAEPTGNDNRSQWLGFSNPQIVLPADQ